MTTIIRTLDAFPMMKQRLSAGLTVFSFHDVTDRPSEFEGQFSIATALSTFASQIKWITDRYTIVHPESLLDSRSLPASGALLTFDDGWRGIFDYALPFLEGLGCPSLVFLNMASVLGHPDLTALQSFRTREPGSIRNREPGSEGSTLHPDNPANLECTANERLSFSAYQGQFATPGDLAHWANDPLVRYGNHLFRHWNGMSLSDEQLRQEYLTNEEHLLHYRAYLPLFAFPYGKPGRHFGDRQLEVVRRLGAHRTFSTLGIRNSSPLAPVLHRITLFPDERNSRDLLFHTRIEDIRRPFQLRSGFRSQGSDRAVWS